MWNRDIDTGKWFISTDELSKDNYDNLKQDLEKIRFYSNCLSGSSYLLINQFDNIYESLSYKNSDSWYISSAGSNYSSSPVPSLNAKPIDKLSIDEYLLKYNKDYGFSIKNSFTPKKIIEKSSNFINVDVCTVGDGPGNVSSINITQQNLPIGVVSINLTIDGIVLKEGHSVLLKDQISFVDLSKSLDPKTYFKGNYYIFTTNTSSITYYYYNEENGLYSYKNSMLVRESDLDIYDKSYNFSVCVKLGDINRDKEFHLSRKLDGYFPISSEPMEFTEKHNWILRNQVDYNNIYDINYYDVLKHATQSYTFDSYTYSIPQRTVAVGEFGIIINNQDNVPATQSYNLSHIINNKYKVNLRSISQTSGYYWVCGDNGTLIKVSKVDFSITKIELNELSNLQSISFYDNLRGVVVGKFNSIYYTEDGGYNWVKILFTEFDEFSYKKVIFTRFESFFVGGENGVFIEFKKINNNWTSYLRKISKKIDSLDEYLLIDDINDMIKVTFGLTTSTSWSLTYSTSNSSSISNIKEAILIAGNNDNLIVYDYNNFIDEHQFIYLNWIESIGDIKSVSYEYGTDNIYITSDNIYKFSINDFSQIGTVSNLIISDGSVRDRVDILDTSWDSSNLTYLTQISPSLIGLTPSSGGARSWNTQYIPWSSSNSFQINQEFVDDTTWTKGIGTSSTIYSGSIVDFYSSVTYYKNNISLPTGVTSEYMVGKMDRLWLIGQDKNGDWELIKEANQVLDKTDGIPAYVINKFKLTKDYISIGFIVNQQKYVAASTLTISDESARPISFYMGDIQTFNISFSIPNKISDYYTNKIFDFNGLESIIVGNNGLIRNNNYIGNTYSVLDPTFDSKIKSKFLFLDYDVSSKLNFFDDNGDYRLPSSITFDESLLNGNLSISNITSEYNWLKYYKDSEKTFTYYSSFDDSNRVEFSTTFSYATFSSFTFSKSDISINYSDIVTFAPNIGSTTQSRYVQGPVSLSISPSLYSVFVYKYLIIFKRPILEDYKVGDVLSISSDVVDSKLVINRILTDATHSYLYVYSEFNNNIINNLSKSSYISSVVNLNKYETITELVSRFELHPVSIGYKLLSVDNSLEISCRFNNKTAYYNMQSIVEIGSSTQSLVYTDSFLNFGFSPTYNILDYLNIIDPIFSSSKQFLSMPSYQNMPGNNNNSFTSSNIYIDGSLRTNKILMGIDFKFEWETIWLNTFVDVILTTGTGTYTSSRMLVINKYYDSTNNGYVIEFNKKLEYLINDSVIYITINSRKTLSEISEDLQILNNIQRSSYSKSVQSTYSFINLENEISSKFNTDSYCKILLSDFDIKDKISAIVYTDDKNILSMNIINLEKDITSNIISTQNHLGYLQVTCDSPHGLVDGDGVVLSFTGGTYSSQYMNPDYNGFQSVKVLNTIQFYTSRKFGVNSLTNDIGKVSYIHKDAFLNYIPTDIMDLGSDKKDKISIEIKPSNVLITESVYSLLNINLEKYRFKLVDGLTLEELSSKYSWILEAEISDAIIGKDSNGVIWYSGIWRCGRWFGGTWMSGTWLSGDFYSGVWNSKSTKYRTISVEVSSKNDNTSSKWFDGRWFDGKWNGGTWYNGRKYAGDWTGGIWYNGIWNGGTWYDGLFSGGIWVSGIWKKGIFNTNNKPAYWIDGTWGGGDFENGRWFNGEFNQIGGNKSRFGIKASNSRNATWDSGRWLSGEFHSFLNTNDSGTLVSSDIHKYSYWKTGTWNNGDFYGGVVYNINFRGGNFYGGIVDDIQIEGIDIDNDEIILNGIFRFNIGDEINIIDDGDTSQYSKIGSLSNPSKYKISFITIDEIAQTTTIKLLYDLGSLGSFTIKNQTGIDLGLRVVSKFSNTKWYSGLWYNGIFDGDFMGGMWYNGVFLNGNWGQ